MRPLDPHIENPYTAAAAKANPPVRSQVSATYEWKSCDLDKVRLVPALVETFLEPGAGVQASLGRNGPGQPTQTYTSLDAWSAALSPDWDSFKLYGNTPTRWLSIEFRLPEHQVVAMFNAAGAEMQPVTSALAELQKTLALPDPKPTFFPPPAPEKPKERVDGRYHVEHPEDAGWFAQLMEFVESWIGPLQSFNGSFSLLSAPQFRQSPARYEVWKQQCFDNWKDMLSLYGYARGQSRDATVNFYVNRADLTISLSAENAAEVAEAFKAAEKQLPILPARDLVPPDARSEQRRRYFVNEPIDKAWFERCTALLRSVPSAAKSGGNVSFQGRFRIKGREEEAFSRTNFDAWMSDVAAEWNRIVWLYCWISAPDIAVTFEVDLLRDLITLTLQSSMEQTVKAGFRTVEAGLAVKKVDGDPYQYRRFLRSFKIERWTTNKAFADAVRASVAFAFPHRDPAYRLALTRAYIAVGETAEDLEPFTDYELFCQRVESQDFTRAEVILQGPLGRALGIEANRKNNMLYVRTSLDRAELDDLTLPFRNALELGKPDTKVFGESKKEEAKSGGSVAQIVTVVCALIAATAAVLTSSNGLSQLRRHSVLQITYPVTKDGAPVQLDGKGSRLAWQLTTTTITGPTSTPLTPVTIHVYRDGNEQAHYSTTDGSYGLPPLAPGAYDINVVSDLDHSNGAWLRVNVPQEVKAEQPDGEENKAATHKHGN